MAATQLVIGLSLGALALGGCARNLCESDAEDPRCVVTAQPEKRTLTVTPQRLALSSGGAIEVAVQPAPIDGALVVLQQSGAKDLTLGSMKNGKVTITLKPSEFAEYGFSTGEAKVRISTERELVASLRLVVEPQFTQPALTYDASTSSDSPLWIAVNQANTIYTLNQYPLFPGSSDRQLRLGEYQLNKSVLELRAQQTFGAYKGYPFQPNPAGFAVLNGANLVVMSKNPVNVSSPILADRCVFATGKCEAINPAGFGFKSIAGLASDRTASLFAVQSDIGTLAYRGSDMNPFDDKLAIDHANKPAGGNVVTMAAGDVDGDAQSDLVVFQSAPAGVSVYLRQTGGQQLRYSDTQSTKLQGALGSLLPTAAAIADMDADGLADLVVMQNGAVSLLYNLGGSWAPAAMPLQLLANADSLAVGTVDPGTGSGGKVRTLMDIAVASSSGMRIAVLINQSAF